MKETLEMLKESGIDGCITGSALADWSLEDEVERPDIDVFTYSDYAMVHALDVLEYRYGLKPGGDAVTTDKGERWKVEQCRSNGRNRRELVTCKMTDGHVTVNVSNRKNEQSAMDVICRFDMSIVMQAYDIRSGTVIDLRECAPRANLVDVVKSEGRDTRVAVPNPFREFKGTTWDAQHWLRQWDRVIKYWNRGFDTRPMARFYRWMLDEVIDGGCLFKTERSKEQYELFVKEFADLGEKIDIWLKDKED